MTKTLTIGNITTVINTIIVIVAGYIFAGLLAYFGNLPFTETQLTEILGIIVFAAFSYVNAKKHNTFWNRDTDEITINLDDVGSDDELQETIQDLVDRYQANNTIDVEVNEDDIG